MRFYHQATRELVIPSDAGPDDSAITIGPDLPPCMVLANPYGAAIFARPDGAADGLIPQHYFGILSFVDSETGVVWDEGWTFIADDGTVCSFTAPLSQSAVKNAITENWQYNWEFESDFGLFKALANTISLGGEIIDLTAIGGPTKLTGPTVTVQLDNGIDVPNEFAVEGLSTHTKFKVTVDAADFTVPLTTSGGLAIPEPADPFTIDGTSAPRGTRFYMASSTATGAIGTVFTVALSSLTDWICRDGRAYKVTVGGGGLSTSVGTNVAAFVLNKTVAGVESNLLDFGWVGPQVGAFPQNVTLVGVVVNATGADVTCDGMSLYLKSSAGTVNWLVNPGTGAIAVVPRWVEIVDIGAASDYPGALSI